MNKYHFWYSKKGEAKEMLLHGNEIGALNQAHDILRGFYARSEQDELDKCKFWFYNSRGECVGILVPLQELGQEEKPRDCKKGLATLGEMVKMKV